MASQSIFTDYLDNLMAHAVYDKLDDGTYSGRIPQCVGVISFGTTVRECEDELHSTLEDWVLLGSKLGQPLPLKAM